MRCDAHMGTAAPDDFKVVVLHAPCACDLEVRAEHPFALQKCDVTADMRGNRQLQSTHVLPVPTRRCECHWVNGRKTRGTEHTRRKPKRQQPFIRMGRPLLLEAYDIGKIHGLIGWRATM